MEENRKVYTFNNNALVCTNCGNIIHNVNMSIDAPIEDLDIDLSNLVSITAPTEFTGLCESCSVDYKDPKYYIMVRDYMSSLVSLLIQSGFQIDNISNPSYELSYDENTKKIYLSTVDPIITFYAYNEDEETDEDDIVENNYNIIANILNDDLWKFGAIEEEEVFATYAVQFNLCDYLNKALIEYTENNKLDSCATEEDFEKYINNTVEFISGKVNDSEILIDEVINNVLNLIQH